MSGIEEAMALWVSLGWSLLPLVLIPTEVTQVPDMLTFKELPKREENRGM
jgi:hypothetical protein